MPDGEIAPEDPRTPDVRALLQQHLAFARETTPAEGVHALDVDALLDPAVTLFAYRRDGELLAVGAVKLLDTDHAELKSMHTAEAARRQGVGRAMVDHLVGVARGLGVRRVSLETGNFDAFAPARALYASAGFEPCEPFGEYVDSPTSACMTRRLDDPIANRRRA
jgi:putative acetyltransferase